ncbi:MAG: radical SAM protein [Candidatus Buchananbacteria bacterium]|nr:radical SAM protein [Candidatus Buchananbacteria bacterium]
MTEENKPIIDILLINFGRVNKVGIFTLAGYCRSQNFKVKIIDGGYESILSQFEILNQDNKILSVGFTATTDVIDSVSKLATAIKNINKDIFLILGGYHGTTLPEDILSKSDFDLVVVREGEITLSQILSKLKEKIFPTQESGCYEKVNGQIIFNGYRPFITDLDILPYPAYDLVDMKKYFHGIRLENELKKVVVLLISRGCPFDCVFCGSKNMWQRRFRIHSVDYVMGLIKWLIEKYDIEGISFLDDELVTNKKYISDLCDRFIAEGINKKIKWSCHARVSSVDEDILIKMKKAGCILVRFGVESGSPNMLAYLKNNSVKISQSYQAVALCQKVGLPSFGSFIIGSPDETVDDIVQTIDFIQKSGLAYVDVFSMVPYPGTDIYDLAKSDHLIKENTTWDDFKIEGDNCRAILRSRNFDFDQIDNLKSYVNLNVVYPLNHKIPRPFKLNHKVELEKVLSGNLSHTEFSKAGQYQMKLMKLYDKMIRVIKDPKLLLVYLNKKFIS